jgi:DNA-binding transcriptional LysR family regulator
MDQDHINYVQVVIDEGGISNAARKLNISQPALSARIRKIEEDFGIVVFDKNHRPALLTEDGRRYLEYVQRQQLLEKSFRQYISDSKNLRTGELRIGGTHLYTQCFLPGVIKRFIKLYPGISIKIVNASAPVLTAMVSKGELDLFITSPGKNSQGLRYEPLFDTRLYLCVPAEYEVNRELGKKAVRVDGFSGINLKKCSIDPKQLEDYTFVLLEESQLMGGVMRTVFRKYGVCPQSFIYTDQAMTAYALTQAGLGISLMFDRTLSQVGDDSRVCYYTLDDELMTGEMRVAYADMEYPPLVVREFIKCMHEVI